MLADNRIALNAGWDAEMLKLELTDLGKLGADLKMLGSNEQDLAAELGRTATGLVHEDEVPELADTAISRPGDIWLLGATSCGLWRLHRCVNRGRGTRRDSAPVDGDRSTLRR
ncbi:hypothetical protein [Bradyrhizobium sp. SZCCHNRI3037]|uniref:hypothetical protein n=1 Tax=Bradyrhizobium sp. SZCCHNRI3037 TaxID=3057290 RepID=UPI002916356A|nr:hypothetical protein [Bradyrhizobium sp. SZCCHNRI3037]